MIEHLRFRHAVARGDLRPSRRLLGAAARGLSVCGVACLFMGLIPACEPPADHRYISTTRLARIGREPTVRVRIASSVTRLRLDGPPRLRFRSLNARLAPTHEWVCATPVDVHRRQDGFFIRPARGPSMAWNALRISATPERGTTIRLEGVAYPQKIVLHAVDDGTGSENRCDAVNHVTLERYLPGVLHKELYRDWPASAFQAQAIAARSYAIVQCAENWQRHFDLESTTASQVYGGAAAHWKAVSATRKTRGVVLAYRGQVVPAYYSSCCGGTGQDAAAAFPHGSDIQPLWGRSHGGWCAISPHYRWGPVTRSRADLTQRLAAWGAAHKHPIAGIRSIADIQATRHNAVDRPTGFVVTDMTGRTFAMKAESFRIACNYQGPGAPELSTASLIKSSHLTVQIEADILRFSGRGYGHGVGLCQWGTYTMAKRGHDADTILPFYYPGATVTKVY